MSVLRRGLPWLIVYFRGQYRGPPAWAGVLLVTGALVAGCSPGSTPKVTAIQKAPTTTTSTLAPTTTTTTTTIPPFTSVVSLVTTSQLGATWHIGCPVDANQLRQIQMDYWGFDNQAHVGTMVVNAAVVQSVIHVFSMLYAARFPIYEMIPQSMYGGVDDVAAAADDTSGFNCRFAVAPGPPQWSMHAYGEAIDVNDVQNPYIDGATIIPPAGAAYEDRADVRPGMAVLGGTLVNAFASVGWPWGGRWTGGVDYQHFSLNGR